MPRGLYGYGGDPAEYAAQQSQQSQESWNNIIQLIVSFLGQKKAGEQWGQEFDFKRQQAEADRQFNEKQLALQGRQEDRLSRPQPADVPEWYQQALLIAKQENRPVGEVVRDMKMPQKRATPAETYDTSFAGAAGGRAGAPPIDKPAQWETPEYAQGKNLDQLLSDFEAERTVLLQDRGKNIAFINDKDTTKENRLISQARNEELNNQIRNITAAQNYLRKTRLKIGAKQPVDETTWNKIGAIAGDLERVKREPGFWDKEQGGLEKQKVILEGKKIHPDWTPIQIWTAYVKGKAKLGIK